MMVKDGRCGDSGVWSSKVFILLQLGFTRGGEDRKPAFV